MVNLTSTAVIKKLLKRHGVFASKRLGQNFLIDQVAVWKIIKTANLRPDDIVLEIGSGPGVLTQDLAKGAKRVIAVEKDQKMVEILKETLHFPNIEIIHSDILKIFNFLPRQIFAGRSNYKVVGNLPFYLTAPAIRKFLECKFPPYQMVLVVQKEVAQRICAKVPKMNLLAVSVQFYAQPKIISYLSKKSFWPRPKVDSAIIKITPYINNYPLDKFFIRKFFQIVKAGFSQPRKQLLNNLANSLKLNKEETKNWLLKNNIQPERRAETLSLDDWINLTKSFTIKQ